MKKAIAIALAAAGAVFICAVKCAKRKEGVRRIYILVKMAFGIDVEMNIIRNNIMINWNLRCPRSDKKDRKIRGLKEDEQSKLVAYLWNYKSP